MYFKYIYILLHQTVNGLWPSLSYVHTLTKTWASQPQGSSQATGLSTARLPEAIILLVLTWSSVFGVILHRKMLYTCDIWHLI